MNQLHVHGNTFVLELTEEQWREVQQHFSAVKPTQNTELNQRSVQQ